ncbi:cyclic nucleotide-binding domain-containing protein [Komagataeibacter europaeus]|uniref:hypothetical protein n=1 Tax=Komagataeibacter europaeus TaxID=33995 RepID=UPI001EE2163E|nr:hypothetical protein [Komagataeibacter europaeus]
MNRQEFMTESMPANMHFHVVSGGARLFKSLPDGRRQIIGFAHKGDVLPAYPCTHYHYSAEAMQQRRSHAHATGDVRADTLPAAPARNIARRLRRIAAHRAAGAGGAA